MSDRPLSPHLQIYKIQITNLFSIIHRLTGILLFLLLVMLSWYFILHVYFPKLFIVKYLNVLLSKKDIKLLEEIGSSWKCLANFESAFNHISNLTPTDAASIYNDMADNQDIPNVLRELAQYLEVMSLFCNNEKINEDKINNLESSIVYPYSSQEAIAIIKYIIMTSKGAVKILHSLLNDRKCPTLIKD